MKFKTVQDLIDYLGEFNPNARVLTDMGFSWSKPMGEVKEDTRLTTNILYVYGDYNPYYEDNQNYYRIKDFIIDNYMDKFQFKSCTLYFDEEGIAGYYLKHNHMGDFPTKMEIQQEIFKGIYDFCEENGFTEEFKTISIILNQDIHY